MKIKKIVTLAAFLTILGFNSAYSQSLGDILGGNLGQTIGNVLEGVFSSSNITIADMEGEWTSTGPAVCFQGEGFLKKAGGVAAAAAIETKLSPYYEQYGLNNAKLTIDKDGNFTLVCKAIRLNGTISRQETAEKGVFEFNFTALGMKLTSVPTYVQKTSGSMDVMFDATKLKKLISAISQFSGLKTVQTLSSILDSYDGLCVGFHLSGGPTKSTTTGNGFSLGNILGGLGNNSNSGAATQTNGNSSQTNTGNDSTSKSENNSSESENNSNVNQNENSEIENNITTGIDLLRGILGKGKK